MNLLNSHNYIKNNFDIPKNKSNSDNLSKDTKVSFKDVLSQQSQLQDKVVFSKHANIRIN